MCVYQAILFCNFFSFFVRKWQTNLTGPGPHWLQHASYCHLPETNETAVHDCHWKGKCLFLQVDRECLWSVDIETLYPGGLRSPFHSNCIRIDCTNPFVIFFFSLVKAVGRNALCRLNKTSSPLIFNSLLNNQSTPVCWEEELSVNWGLVNLLCRVTSHVRPLPCVAVTETLRNHCH